MARFEELGVWKRSARLSADPYTFGKIARNDTRTRADFQHLNAFQFHLLLNDTSDLIGLAAPMANV